MVTVAVSVPPLFDAVIVYTVDGDTTVGVPLISPVDESMFSPVGRLGEIDHVATGPPVELGVMVLICRLICVVSVVVPYPITGTASFTSIVTIVEALPPVLLAVTVYAVDGVIAVGVPVMAPVEADNESPVGSDGDIVQVVTVPPLYVGIAVCISEPLDKDKELGAYSSSDGATSFTVMLTKAVSVPPAFVAVTVKFVAAMIAVGVPEI